MNRSKTGLVYLRCNVNEQAAGSM